MPAKKRAPKSTTPTTATANAQVFDSNWSGRRGRPSREGAAGVIGFRTLSGALIRYWCADRSSNTDGGLRSLDVDIDHHPGEDGEEGVGVGVDTDERIWPGEFVPPTIVVTEPEADLVMVMVRTRIMPEEVECFWCRVRQWYHSLIAAKKT